MYSSQEKMSSSQGKEKLSPTIIKEHQKLFLNCISDNLGFYAAKPVTARLIYKCLLHWRSFESDTTTIFDQIFQTMSFAILLVQENNVSLAYWLSNSSTLLHRISKAQVELKYPALLFKKQLIAFINALYEIITQNLKKEISPLLEICIQTSRAKRRRGHSQSYRLVHWQAIVKILQNCLRTMRENYVPILLIRRILCHMFSFINVELLNSLTRSESCSFSNVEYLKVGLALMETWHVDATQEVTGLAWDELKHIRQAVEFMVPRQKPKKTIREMMNQSLCPVLGKQPLHRTSTMCRDDKYGTHTVGTAVIENMRVLMTESANDAALSCSFLLDDSSSIEFSLDDLLISMEQTERTDPDVPPLFCENSGFTFLLTPSD